MYIKVIASLSTVVFYTFIIMDIRPLNSCC